MLNWFRGKATAASAGTGMSRAFCADGLVLAHNETDLPTNSLDPRRVESVGLEGLLAQLDDEGLVVAQGAATLIPWDNVFQILENPDYRGCRELLGLPEDTGLVPGLESYHTLNGQGFCDRGRQLA